MIKRLSSQRVHTHPLNMLLYYKIYFHAVLSIEDNLFCFVGSLYLCSQ